MCISGLNISIVHHFQDIIESIISQILNKSHDCDHTHLTDYLEIQRLILHMANQCKNI